MTRSLLVALALVTATVTACAGLTDQRAMTLHSTETGLGPMTSQNSGYIEHSIVIQVWPKGASPDAGTEDYTYTKNTYPTYNGCREALEGADKEYVASVPALMGALKEMFGEFEHRWICRQKGRSA
jgi:hypothetical protein